MATQLLVIECNLLVPSLCFRRYVEANDLRTRTDILPNEGFITADHTQARDKNDVHLNGVFVAHSQHVKRLNGYDERIEAWGYDDGDMYIRLSGGEAATHADGSRWGLITRDIGSESLINHIVHPPSPPSSSPYRSLGNCVNADGIALLQQSDGPWWGAAYKLHPVVARSA